MDLRGGRSCWRMLSEGRRACRWRILRYPALADRNPGKEHTLGNGLTWQWRSARQHAIGAGPHHARCRRAVFVRGILGVPWHGVHAIDRTDDDIGGIQGHPRQPCHEAGAEHARHHLHEHGQGHHPESQTMGLVLSAERGIPETLHHETILITSFVSVARVNTLQGAFLSAINPACNARVSTRPAGSTAAAVGTLPGTVLSCAHPGRNHVTDC